MGLYVDVEKEQRMYTLEHAEEKEICEQIRLCLERAEALFDVDMNALRIRFDLKGLATARACFEDGEFVFRCNPQAIRLDQVRFVQETIPHEIAHFVGFVKPHLAQRHNKGWKRTCILLGGSGLKYHQLPLDSARKIKKYAYISTTGHAVTLTAIRHNRIQKKDASYSVTGKGSLNKTCDFVQIL